MYKLFFWDSIDISIRGVVVPDNDIGIEETLDHERGICYEINFTYPDSRIGRYLAANFWFVRWKPKRITCARGRQPFAGLEFCWLCNVTTITMAAKNLSSTHLPGSIQKLAGTWTEGRGQRGPCDGSVACWGDTLAVCAPHQLGCMDAHRVTSSFRPCELWDDISLGYDPIGTIHSGSKEKLAWAGFNARGWGSPNWAEC